ncbi:hypothetical protein B9Z19DRAFT_794141 [Tuber borchii]|uniref:Uncharacterized protein n=1 Tax=Tuber borchii TaxID=42251 RepID=A0A2T6ZW64_TUBBO|nr:hypothetical protein B9Z19DRAFT_794141 [Tuber borchii]
MLTRTTTYIREKQRANIPIETCVSQYAPTITACVGGDYACQCTAYTNLLTCYNNCPNDKNSSGVKSSVTSFCNAAAAASSASSLTNTATSTSGTGSSTAASSKPTSSGSPTTTKAPSSSSSSSSGSGSTNAALALTPAGTYGALAGVMAIAGIFL